MAEISELQNIINGFNFERGNYIGAQKQLFFFAESYARLSIEEADRLRSNFDAKERLKWFRLASALMMRCFDSADELQKEKLFRIFFSLYSFENLEFGYDAVQNVISASYKMKKNIELSKKIWREYRDLTSNQIARNNIENKIFS